MGPISSSPVSESFRPGHRGFLSFCRAVGFPLEGWQRKIVHALSGPERELLCLLPKGNGKTSLMAAWALWHLLVTEKPMVYFGAASVAQARLGFEAARALCAHELIVPLVVIRSLEIRRADGQGTIRMVPADGPRSHGITYSAAICDELWAHRDAALYESMRSALIKRADARLVTTSTADSGADRPLSKLRARALAAPTVKRTGQLTDCSGAGLRALLWEVADGTRPDDLRSIAACNPASWITRELIGEQRAALPPGPFMRFHANARVDREGAWLPAGAWQRCVGQPHYEQGESIWIGVDVGGERSATAVVWVNAALHVGCSIYHGEEGVLEAVEQVRDLAGTYRVEELIYDPWRFRQAALELEREGIRAVQFPQSDVRMVPASSRLRDAIVQGRLVLPPDPELAAHAAAAVQRHGRRGWRIDRPDRTTTIDAIIALCMALDRAEQRPEPVKLLGWI